MRIINILFTLYSGRIQGSGARVMVGGPGGQGGQGGGFCRILGGLGFWLCGICSLCLLCDGLMLFGCFWCMRICGFSSSISAYDSLQYWT